MLFRASLIPNIKCIQVVFPSQKVNLKRAFSERLNVVQLEKILTKCIFSRFFGVIGVSPEKPPGRFVYQEAMLATKKNMYRIY